MIPLPVRALRALSAGFLAASLIGALAPLPSRAAQPPASMTQAQDEMAQRLTKHLQAHLDQLAGRLEIKASQEPAWQTFSGALRDVMSARLADRERTAGADADAASLARLHAERAAEQAQRLARLADATAKLQQGLSPDQRLVLNEVAQRFAQQRFEHGPMGGHGYEHRGPHCDGAEGSDGRGGWEHRPGQQGGMDGSGPVAPGGDAKSGSPR